MTRPFVRALLIILAMASMPTLDGCGQGGNDLPECLQKMVAGDPEWPHELIYPSDYISRCNYDDRIVYFMPSQCCDIPSYLFDADCNIICSPDGGYSGTGDGRCPEFSEAAANCEEIWIKPD